MSGPLHRCLSEFFTCRPSLPVPSGRAPHTCTSLVLGIPGTGTTYIVVCICYSLHPVVQSRVRYVLYYLSSGVRVVFDMISSRSMDISDEYPVVVFSTYSARYRDASTVGTGRVPTTQLLKAGSPEA